MPYEKVILGPKYAVRLSDLQASDAIFARCLGCNRAWRIAPHRLYDRLHRSERLVQIGKLMRCPQCRNGDAMTWHVLRASAL